ncbi:MAG: DUF4159 domain-containing protein, partial [Candidatus Omnitrophica bacterium]|nr:DUF4159 domain-containing protein [Candidatus Omnitrophota bacterium]
ELITPKRDAVTVDRKLDMPALNTSIDVGIEDFKIDLDLKGLGNNIDMDKSMANKLSFASTARVTGRGKRIRGRLVFPISTYADWDNDPTTIPNLMNELGRRTNIKVSIEEKKIDFTDKKGLFKFPMLFMNGHDAFRWSSKEIKNLREYLTRGGFFFVVNDNAEKGPFEDCFYKEMKKVFPKKNFKKLRMSHPIWQSFYKFKKYGDLGDALYKDLPVEAYATYHNERMIMCYLATGDVCDGWAEAGGSKWPGTQKSHHDYAHSNVEGQNQPGAGDEGIENSFKIGINIIVYALTNM